MTPGDPALRALEVLRGKRFMCSGESELQRLVASSLDEAAMPYEREKVLTARDRVDFLIAGGVALELKVRTSEKNLLRQVLRYAEHADVTSVIVAGTCHSVLRLPRSANGKPVYALHLMSW